MFAGWQGGVPYKESGRLMQPPALDWWNGISTEAEADATHQAHGLIGRLQRAEHFVTVVVAEFTLVAGFLDLIGTLSPVLIQTCSRGDGTRVTAAFIDGGTALTGGIATSDGLYTTGEKGGGDDGEQGEFGFHGMKMFEEERR